MSYRFLLAFLALAAVAPIARADTFSFSGTAAGFSATGTFTASADTTPGVDDITGISGQINGVAIASLLPGSYDAANPSTVNFFTDPSDNYTYGDFYDNLYFTSGTPLDEYGVAFTLADGTLAGLYDDNGLTYYVSSQNYTLADISNPIPGVPLGSSSLAPTPEPSSLLLLATGALLLAGGLLRRTNRLA